MKPELCFARILLSPAVPPLLRSEAHTVVEHGRHDAGKNRRHGDHVSPVEHNFNKKTSKVKAMLTNEQIVICSYNDHWARNPHLTPEITHVYSC